MKLGEAVFSWWFPIAAMLFLFFGGPLLSAAGIISPELGFYLFLSSTIFGIVSSITGIRYVIFLHRRIGFPSLYSGLLQLGFLFSFALTVKNTPFINDITTDLKNPPPLSKAAENLGLDSIPYPEKFSVIQKNEYSGIKPVFVSAPPEKVYQYLINKFKKNSRINILDVSEDTHSIQAYEVSAVFGFIDDFTIRISEETGGSIVDMRSRSRFNLFDGDFGINAFRVQTTLANINL